MRTFKIYLSLILLGLIPLVLLSIMSFASVDEQHTFCISPRYCRYYNCSDEECFETKTVTRRRSLSLFEAIEMHPLLVVFILVAIVSYTLFIIALKKNAYSYIGYEDLGLLGIISMGLYILNGVLLCIVPMFLFKQVGHGPLFVMLVMGIVPFIVRPIVVDW